MSGSRSDLVQVVLADKRYAIEAYEFLWHALTYTQEKRTKSLPQKAAGSEEQTEIQHVTGQELMDGVRQLALEQFGMMAPVVFRLWGVRSTSDFGAMVYRLIDAGIWHRSPTDRLEDFDDCFDFQRAFVDDFRLEWDEAL